jgi:hypothetical protein
VVLIAGGSHGLGVFELRAGLASDDDDREDAIVASRRYVPVEPGMRAVSVRPLDGLRAVLVGLLPRHGAEGYSEDAARRFTYRVLGFADLGLDPPAP